MYVLNSLPNVILPYGLNQSLREMKMPVPDQDQNIVTWIPYLKAVAAVMVMVQAPNIDLAEGLPVLG